MNLQDMIAPFISNRIDSYDTESGMVYSFNGAVELIQKKLPEDWRDITRQIFCLQQLYQNKSASFNALSDLDWKQLTIDNRLSIRACVSDPYMDKPEEAIELNLAPYLPPAVFSWYKDGIAAHIELEADQTDRIGSFFHSCGLYHSLGLVKAGVLFLFDPAAAFDIRLHAPSHTDSASCPFVIIPVQKPGTGQEMSGLSA